MGKNIISYSKSNERGGERGKQKRKAEEEEKWEEGEGQEEGQGGLTTADAMNNGF